MPEQIGFVVGAVHPAQVLASKPAIKLPVFNPELFNTGNFGSVFRFIGGILVHLGLIPKVIIDASPSDGVNQKIRQELMHPKTQAELLRSIKKSIEAGAVPSAVNVYLSSLPTIKLGDVVRELLSLAKEEADTPKILRSLKSSFGDLTKSQVIVAKQQISLDRVGEKHSGGERVSFDVTTHPWIGPSDKTFVQFHMKNFQHPHMRIDNVHEITEKEISTFVNLWVGKGYSIFKTEANRMSGALGGLVEDRALINRYIATTGAKTTSPESDIDLGSHSRREAMTDRVSPSIYSGGPHETSFVVSARDSERVWQKADGTYTKPKRQRQNWTNAKPVSNFPPILISEKDGGRFTVKVGLTYDHPLFGRVKSQTWWYSSKPSLISAMESYTRLTGSRADIVFLVSDATTNMTVDYSQIKQARTEPLRELRKSIRSLLGALQTAYQNGFSAHEGFLRQYGPKELYDQWRQHKNNLPTLMDSKNPPDLKQTEWREFVKTLRYHAHKDLQIIFTGELAVGDARKEFDKLRAKKEAHLKTRKRLHARYSGEKNEPWSLYFVEYVLAYNQATQARAGTVMIPTNVVRKDIPGDTGRFRVDRVSEEWLRKQMKSLFNGPMFHRDQEWTFIPGNLRQPFPYARLIRDAWIKDPERVKAVHAARYKGTGAKRTERGYHVGDGEYEAYVMVVAMPKSKGSVDLKKGGYALTPKGQDTRRFADDPHRVTRAAKHGGLSSYPQTIVVPDPRSKEVKNEVLVRYPRGGSGPYSGQTQYNRIRAGTFKIWCGHQEGTSDINGNIVSAHMPDPGNKNRIVSGNKIVSGKIDFKTGKWSVTFANPVSRHTPIMASYYTGSGVARMDPHAGKFISPTHPQISRSDVTVMSPGFSDQLANRHHIEIEGILRRTKGYVDSVTYNYKIGQKKDREKLLNDYLGSSGTRAVLRELTKNMIQVNLKDHIRVNFAGLSNPEHVIVDYIGWVDKNLRTMPYAGKKLGMVWWHAPALTSGGATMSLKIPAPTEDVGRLVLLYKLLRRSPHNKNFGKIAKVKDIYTKSAIFPEINARLITMWGRSNFVLLPDNDPKGVRFEPPPASRMKKHEYFMRKAEPFGAHKLAHMWRREI